MRHVTIFADGVRQGRSGTAGWAAILLDKETGAKKELSGGFTQVAEGRIEIMAVVEALEVLSRPCIVTVYTPSRSVVENARKGSLPRRNQDLWRRYADTASQHQIHFFHLQDRCGVMERRCNELAQEQCHRRDLPLDELPRPAVQQMSLVF